MDDLLPVDAATLQTPTRAAGQSVGHLRVGDEERSRVCAALSDHFAAGRLSPEDLDYRLGAATVATRQSDLADLVADLPLLGARVSPPATPAVAQRRRWTGWDTVTVLVAIGGMVTVLVMLLGSAVLGMAVTLFSLIGGLIAAATGGAIVHLAHRGGQR